MTKKEPLTGVHAEVAARYTALISNYIGQTIVPVVEEAEEN